MMKTIPMPDMSQMSDEEADDWYNDGHSGSFGSRNSYEAIQTFDTILKPFGLQVGLYDSGDSDYRVTIVPLDSKEGGEGNPVIEALERELTNTRDALTYAREDRDKVRNTLSGMLSECRFELDEVETMSAADGRIMSKALLDARIAGLEDLQKKLRQL